MPNAASEFDSRPSLIEEGTKLYARTTPGRWSVDWNSPSVVQAGGGSSATVAVCTKGGAVDDAGFIAWAQNNFGWIRDVILSVLDGNEQSEAPPGDNEPPVWFHPSHNYSDSGEKP